MKLYSAAVALLVLTLCLSSEALARYDVKAAMVMDMSTRTILYEQNADKKIAPASLTKILTMYLVWEDIEQRRVKLGDSVRISRAAAATGGSSMKLVRNEQVTVEDLLRGMGIASGNDACVAVAEYLSGNTKDFVQRMNRKAKFLGMTNSTFKNPHGLPAKGQLTTARDMLRLADAYLRRFPDSLEIHSKTHMYHNKQKRKNSNKLLGSVDGVDGLKTGYVAASGFNIIVTAKRGNRRLLAVVLGGRTSAVRNREAKKLLEASFATSSPNEPTLRLAQASQPVEQDVQVGGVVGSTQVPGVRLAVPEGVAAQTAPVRARSVEALERQVLATQYLEPVYALHESSWRTRGKADQRAGALRKRGVDARIEKVDLGSKGVWHRVYIGSFESMRQARNYKENLARKLKLRHAVIMKVDS